MNFAEIIKTEIINKPIKDKHCRKAFLAGLIRGSGMLYEKDGELGLDFKVNTEELPIEGRTTKGKTLKNENKKRLPEKVFKLI